ncbi:MAG: peptidoglycan synthetase [Chlorobi bacterium]|nr:peptidoglycan synthetase [Chlorobiota bacterium]
MRIHFIALGGSAMHNLAIALRIKGYDISGSDDEIFEPSRGRLDKYGILPKEEGWDANRVDTSLDAVIVGMHAKNDNPELLKAKELGMKIFSFPEYLYEHAKNKTRVVIGGSHGKTTITSMILHVMKHQDIPCDYMVGAQLEGFEVMVKLTDNAKIMILEGDEYLTSPLDLRPKFHIYLPDIALISGIAWDHINVFPTFENYVWQFEKFAALISKNGALIYFEDDKNVKTICGASRKDIRKKPYGLPEYNIDSGVTSIFHNGEKIPLQIFGEHNLANMNGARLICNELGVSDEDFYTAIQSFAGAGKRLEKLGENGHSTVFKDFAHSPSKLLATAKAVKNQFPDRELVACMELHTYSSLSEKFLSHYKGCMDDVDFPKVFFSPHALQLKRLEPITTEQVKDAFDNPKLQVYTDSKELLAGLLKTNWRDKNLLMMSSGNFDGVDLNLLAEKVLNNN